MKKNVENMNKNLEAVKEYFTQQGVAFRCDDESGLVLNIEINGDKREVCVRVSDDAVDVQAYYIKENPESSSWVKEALETNYQEMSDYLNGLNKIWTGGTFEVERGKSVSRRTSIPVEDKVQMSTVEDACITGYIMKDWIWTAVLNILNGCSAEEMLLEMMIEVVKVPKKLREGITSEVEQIIENEIVPEIEQIIMEYIG